VGWGWNLGVPKKKKLSEKVRHDDIWTKLEFVKLNSCVDQSCFIFASKILAGGKSKADALILRKL
jgi:ArsR family metal-binding transcriptional regulator